MPQWRKLHLKIIDNLDVNSMPDDFTRYQWALLTLIADKEGRGVYRGSWLKSKMYPMRDNVSAARVMNAMEWYASRGMIVVYEVDGQEYFYITRFHEYQSTEKEGRSQLPEPTDTNSRPTPDLLQTNSGKSPSQIKNREDKNREGAKKPAPPQTSKSHTPPAVATFREKAKAFPIKAQWPAIEQAVGDAPAALELWGRVVSGYILCGWNPRNVSGMIEFYKRGEVPSGNGKHRPQDQTAPHVKVVTAADIPSIEVSPEEKSKALALLNQRLGKK